LETIVENIKEREAVYRTLQTHIDRANLEQRKMALLLIKIQDFSYLEAVVGFYSLELVSKRVMARLLAAAKSHQSVIQMSLDTFLVIIPKMLNNGHLKIVAESLSRAIREAIKIENESIELKPSIGIVASDDCENKGQDWYENALIAMHKSYNDNLFSTLYEPTFRQQMKKDWDLKRDIEIAIHDNQFELYFQPKIDLKKMKVCGAEALIRWNHPVHGLISPHSYIPIPESSGQIPPITHWVIKAAAQHLSQLLKTLPDFQLSINISVNNLNSQDLIFLLEDSISIWGIPAKNLTVEVTETAIMTDEKYSLNQLNKIRNLGINISIDDFGTGYSSLSYFKSIPATELKIDKSFVDNLLNDDQDRNIVALIIFLAKRFGLKVVAEGVETKETMQEICALQCDYAQGFYFSKPLPYDDFIQWVQDY